MSDTLSLASIYKAGEDAAYFTFCRMRWAEAEGAPVCPRCGSLDTAAGDLAFLARFAFGRY